MVDDRLSDGVRIGQLLASEITGNRGRLRELSLTDADPDVEPTTDGALAYAVLRTDDADEPLPTNDADETTGGTGTGTDGDVVAEVYVQPDRLRVEFVGAPDAAAAAGSEAGLRVRPKAVRPPRTLVFVEDGAQVKWILPVFEAVLDALRE